MRSTWKRAFAALLTIAMLASLLVVPASAAQDTLEFSDVTLVTDGDKTTTVGNFKILYGSKIKISSASSKVEFDDGTECQDRLEYSGKSNNATTDVIQYTITGASEDAPVPVTVYWGDNTGGSRGVLGIGIGNVADKTETSTEAGKLYITTWEATTNGILTIGFNNQKGYIYKVVVGEEDLGEDNIKLTFDVAEGLDVTDLTVAGAAKDFKSPLTVAKSAGVTFKVTPKSDLYTVDTVKFGEDTLSDEDGVYIIADVGVANATVTITAASTRVAATGVTISGDPTTNMKVNDTVTLSAAMEPSTTTDTVSWASRDTGVATVGNDGTVTAKAIGKTTITATASGATAAESDPKATRDVTVIGPDQTGDSYTFESKSMGTVTAYGVNTEVKYDNHFSVMFGGSTKVDTNSKSWDDYSSGVRLGMGGAGDTTQNALKITTGKPATVKIWWVSNKAGGRMALLDSEGAAVENQETAAATADNAVTHSELSIPAAGTYYLVSTGQKSDGTSAGGNYLFKVEVTEAAQKYAINVASGIVGGTVAIGGSLTEAAAGAQVTVTATPATGYTGGTVSVKQGTTDVAVSNGKFTMPAGDVTVSATFTLDTSALDTAIAEAEAFAQSIASMVTEDVSTVPKDDECYLKADVDTFTAAIAAAKTAKANAAEPSDVTAAVTTLTTAKTTLESKKTVGTNETAVSKAAIDAAITAANNAMKDITEVADGTTAADVDKDVKAATATDMATLKTAIATATTAKGTVTTAEEVAAAAKALTDATAAFTAKVITGTKEPTVVVPDVPTVSDKAKTYTLDIKTDVYDTLPASGDAEWTQAAIANSATPLTELGTDGVFTLYPRTESGGQSKWQTSMKDTVVNAGITVGINMQGNVVTGDTPACAVAFTTDGPALVTVWWLRGGGGDRAIQVTNGTTVVETKEQGADSDKLMKSEITVPAAGTWYVGGIRGGSSIGRVSVKLVEESALPTVTKVEISGDKDSVLVGESIDLTAAVTMSDGTKVYDVTWATSDATLATVDETGKVTGVKAAEAVTITATAKADATKKAEKVISVTEPAPETKTVTFVISGATVTDVTVDGVAATLTDNKLVDIVKTAVVTFKAAVADASKTLKVTGATFADGVYTVTADTVTVAAVAADEYTITCDTAANGTVTTDKTTAKAGETVTVTATPAEGYKLEAIKVDGEAIEGTTFTMPAKDVTVSATFVAEGGESKVETFVVDETMAGTLAEETKIGSVDGVDIYVAPGKISYKSDDWSAKTDFAGYIQSDANGKVENDVPTAGYIKLVVTKNGKLSVDSLINAEKDYYVIDQFGDTYTVLKHVEKADPASVKRNETEVIDAKGNHTYYVMVTGSKICFYGISFEATGGEVENPPTPGPGPDDPGPNKPGDETVDVAALNAAIAAADKLADVYGVRPDTTVASNVTNGTKYVLAKDQKALKDAIEAAKAVAAKADATQAEVDKALADLNAAVAAFNAAVKTGTKTGSTGGSTSSVRGSGSSSNPSTTTVTNPDGSKVTTEKKADGSVTITATSPDGEVLAKVSIPATIPSVGYKFVDVPDEHWAAKAINDMAGMGMVQGVDNVNHIFDMNSNITRGSVAAILFRFANGKTGMSQSFTDVAEGQWFTDAVAWANNVGVVTGFEDGSFRPDGNITREQLAVMIARFAKLIGLDTTSSGSLVKFKDSAKVQGWAVDGVTWCVANGIINGRGDGTIDPSAPATRAEAAAMLDRFVNLLK